jgi:hypothetical protein
LNDSDLNDSADDFSLYVCCENDESDENDNSMKNAEIDRDDDSMNDLNEIDRRDFFRTKNLIDEFYLLN